MSEIYWITRLDALIILMSVIATVAGVLSIISGLAWYITDDKKEIKVAKKVFGITTVLTAVFIIALVFTPNSKQMMLIYGVGSTIDYVQENDKTKQLPDKAVEALNKYLDEYNKDEKEE